MNFGRAVEPSGDETKRSSTAADLTTDSEVDLPRTGSRIRWLAPLTLSIALLVAWELLVRLLNVQEIVLPAPSQILIAATDWGLYLPEAWTTLIEAVAGFALASIVGLLLGTFVALSPTVGNAIYPILIASQVTPKVAIAPLMIIWFGFGIGSKIVLTALVAFFPVVINTIVGLNMTTVDGMHLFKSLGATPLQTFFKLRLPRALPVIFSGLKLAATLAVIGAVVGEFAGGSAGLGYLLLIQSGQLQTAAAFANIIYLTLLGLAMFAGVVLAERIVVPAHMLRELDRAQQ